MKKIDFILPGTHSWISSSSTFYFTKKTWFLKSKDPIHLELSTSSFSTSFCFSSTATNLSNTILAPRYTYWDCWHHDLNINFVCCIWTFQGYRMVVRSRVTTLVWCYSLFTPSNIPGNFRCSRHNLYLGHDVNSLNRCIAEPELCSRD